MKNEPKLTTISIRSYYSKALESDMLKWNDELALIERRRAELSNDADALRDGLFDTNAKPENVPAELLKLQGRRLAMDVAEGRLIARKHDFKKLHIDARSAERARLVKLAKARREEIEKALKKADVQTAFMPGVINGDEQVRTLTAAANELQSIENVVTEADERRAEFLAARIAAAVPAF